MGELLLILISAFLGGLVTWRIVDWPGMKDTLLDWRASAQDQLGEDGAVRERLRRSETRRNLAILLGVIVVLALCFGLFSFFTAAQPPHFKLDVENKVTDRCGNVEKKTLTRDMLVANNWGVIAGRDERKTGGRDCRIIWWVTEPAPASQQSPNSDSDQIK